jgi:hypothetical protein
MSSDAASFEVPLDGFVMHLRPSELETVAAGLGEFDSSEEGDVLTLARALRRLAPAERAPAWELAVRRFGRHKPLDQVAGEIGLDEILARGLIERFCHGLTEVPAPEHEEATPMSTQHQPSGP